MKIAFIRRSTLYTVPGGDTVQVVQTAGQLIAMGISVDVLLSKDSIAYEQYDLLHFFNIIRPADIQVHMLPSWFETTGLSSIEAAVMHCNIVITDKGDTREYFGDDAFYCAPSDPESILTAVEQASNTPFHEKLRERILKK